jgi:glycolate oxidase FAD binding subunit
MGAATALALEQILVQLQSMVGEEHASLRENAVIAAPANTEQTAELLRFANTSGLVVMPEGGGTKLQWGNRVDAAVVLSTRRLTQLREHAWQDMTCTVEAGCSWAAMEAALARHGQMVALDPLWPERATVGGVIAANDSGAMRLKFGGLRDLIIGMTVVLADGTAAKSGGKVVKNVAGYDLHKLMTGSFGTLGVITEVNFRLHPAEGNARTWTVKARDEASGATALAGPLPALMDSQMAPSCIQLRAAKQQCVLDVRMAGVPECFDEYASRIRSIFGGFEIAGSDHSVWEARQQIFDSNSSSILKLSIVPGELCAVIAELQQWARAEGAELTIAGYATGLMTVGVDSAPGSVLALVKHLRARLRDFGGSLIVVRMPDALRGELDVWGAPPNSLPLMREIKRRFDPKRILNPGRFLGNI